MERVTECLVTKDEREVIAVVLFSWPIGPTTPDGSVPGTVPPGDNIARTRVMLTADPTRKAPMTHGLLNNSSVAQAQDRERPELTRWLFCGASMLKGASAPLRPCTSGSRCGVLRADWGLPAPLQNVSVGSTNARPRPLHPIDETDTGGRSLWDPIGAREERPRAPTYTFQSLPIIPAHPIPTSEGHDGAAPSREGEHPCKAENSALVRLAHSRVALFHSISAPLLGALRCCLEIGENSLTASKPHSCTSFLNGFSSDPAGPLCDTSGTPTPVFGVFLWVGLRLPMTITPTLGPLCDFSAYLLVYVPAPRVFS
ncbi:hypothetical protein PAPYR_11891 [Paratrimastix pyriformis]|uniref:Uncharacterized protein n=1 Tax=Paratrimastix pyriformis TaxID=342808 RepID=A0ABQ8U8C9_9EUKA|nr:hypothetical protein PAPYR_11891 [Paratrimastix pyriformis]